MKNKTKIILIFLIIFFTIGCVKQRHCDCEKEGILIKYDNYLNKVGLEGECPGSLRNTVILSNGVFSVPIAGKIPEKYLAEDSIKVSVCLKPTYKGSGWCPVPYKLTCIEKMN